MIYCIAIRRYRGASYYSLRSAWKQKLHDRLLDGADSTRYTNKNTRAVKSFRHQVICTSNTYSVAAAAAAAAAATIPATVSHPTLPTQHDPSRGKPLALDQLILSSTLTSPRSASCFTSTTGYAVAPWLVFPPLPSHSIHPIHSFASPEPLWCAATDHVSV